MLFRELKPQHELCKFDPNNLVAMEILLPIVLLLVARRGPLDLVTEQTDDGLVSLPEYWVAIFRLHAYFILNELGNYLGYLLPVRNRSVDLN